MCVCVRTYAERMSLCIVLYVMMMFSFFYGRSRMDAKRCLSAVRHVRNVADYFQHFYLLGHHDRGSTMEYDSHSTPELISKIATKASSYQHV